ncbi:MAG: hypothetical protein ACEY3B_01075 [Wolbachia sp.]
MAQTSKESVEKKFKDVFERSPGAFPEGTSLEEKVNYIAKGTKALKAVKSKELENKMENIAKLNKELEKRQRQNDEEIDKLRRSTQELRKEFDTSKRSRAGAILQEARQDTQLSRIEGLHDNLEFQEAVSNLEETTAEGEQFGRSGQKETSVQADIQLPGNVWAQIPSEPKSQVVSPSASKDSTEVADTLGKTSAKDKSFKQSGQKTSEVSAQTDEVPSEHNAGFSLSRNLKREKSNNKKLEQGEKDSAPQPQENQKEEELFSLLKRFVKKILEKLLGEDEKSVENTHDMREAAQRNTLNNEVQQKSMDQSSFININGKEFNLEPEKAFNYQDKALKVSITYNSPETKQNLQQDTTSLNIANAINLNINGKEYNVQPGESFNYKSPGLEISVINGHQQSKNFDRILNQDQSVSEGLKQATKLENPTITPVNTPKVNTGRER